jgi:hypothetical protein
MHTLKTKPVFYKAVIENRKHFEIRKADRDFQVGDILCLQEYDEVLKAYTGNECFVKVTFLMPGGQYGLNIDYCLMAIKRHQL